MIMLDPFKLSEPPTLLVHQATMEGKLLHESGALACSTKGLPASYIAGATIRKSGVIAVYKMARVSSADFYDAKPRDIIYLGPKGKYSLRKPRGIVQEVGIMGFEHCATIHIKYLTPMERWWGVDL